MLRSVSKSIYSGRSLFASAPRSTRVFSTVMETDQWFLWPRENEGNTYAVNWSLVGDGVTPTGDAYRNARAALLTSKLSAKPASGKVELKDPAYFGDFKLQVPIVYYTYPTISIFRFLVCLRQADTYLPFHLHLLISPLPPRMHKLTTLFVFFPLKKRTLGGWG